MMRTLSFANTRKQTPLNLAEAAPRLFPLNIPSLNAPPSGYSFFFFFVAANIKPEIRKGLTCDQGAWGNTPGLWGLGRVCSHSWRPGACRWPCNTSNTQTHWLYANEGITTARVQVAWSHRVGQSQLLSKKDTWVSTAKVWIKPCTIKYSREKLVFHVTSGLSVTLFHFSGRTQGSWKLGAQTLKRPITGVRREYSHPGGGEERWIIEMKNIPGREEQRLKIVKAV